MGSYFALEKQTQASKSSCEKVYEEEKKESKCILIQIAGSYFNKDRRPIPLSEVDQVI